MQSITIILGIFLLQGCYAGAHVSHSLTNSSPSTDDPLPPTEISLHTETVELVGGLLYKRFDLFTGIGFSQLRINAIQTDRAESTKDLFMHTHLGITADLVATGIFQLSGFGVLAGLDSFLFSTTEGENNLSTEWQTGLQLSNDHNAVRPKSLFKDYVFRLGVTRQKGETRTTLYQSSTGGSAFNAFGVVLTFGANVGYR